VTGSRWIWQGILGVLLAGTIVAVSSRGVTEMLLGALGPTPNYRRKPVAFPAGLVVAVGTITAPILLRLCSGVEEDQLRRTGSFLLLTSGFALAGFVDINSQNDFNPRPCGCARVIYPWQPTPEQSRQPHMPRHTVTWKAQSPLRQAFFPERA
jgi:hypothetical protein